MNSITFFCLSGIKFIIFVASFLSTLIQLLVKLLLYTQYTLIYSLKRQHSGILPQVSINMLKWKQWKYRKHY